MAETYHRHVVYHRWFTGDIFRPLVSVPTLKEAVDYVDEVKGQIPSDRKMKIIDLEHIDMGDMLIAEECSDLIAKFRAERT